MLNVPNFNSVCSLDAGRLDILTGRFFVSNCLVAGPYSIDSSFVRSQICIFRKGVIFCYLDVHKNSVMA